MKFESAVIASASGSVGGLTASRNRFGQYFRRKAIPVDPASSFQVSLRNFFAALQSDWLETLTSSQRSGWDTYAANVPLVDALGNPINVTGRNMYVRSNVARLQATLAQVDEPPTIFALPTIATPAVDFSEAGSVDVSFDDNEAWVDENGTAIACYQSRQQNPTVNFFKGPYRLAGTIEGSSITPPTSPATIGKSFPAAEDNKVFYTFRFLSADGRMSTSIRVPTLVLA